MNSYANSRNKTMGDIGEMGKRLAKEILQYMRELDEDEAISISEIVGKISIIAFSLGGLITRAALPYL